MAAPACTTERHDDQEVVDTVVGNTAIGTSIPDEGALATREVGEEQRMSVTSHEDSPPHGTTSILESEVDTAEVDFVLGPEPSLRSSTPQPDTPPSLIPPPSGDREGASHGGH